jgi:2,4-dienoyl-CoA reductase (NADPH2)
MEAARVAATRGHSVSLYEKDDSLGGQVNLIAACPGRGEFANLVRYLSKQLEKQNVQVFPGNEFTPEMIEEEKPDTIVVATGASPIIPQIPGIDKERVVKAWDVLAGKARVGRKAIIIGGGAVGCDTAIFLAKEWSIDAETAVFLAENGALDCGDAISLANKGRQVTILEMLESLGSDIGPTTRWTVMKALKRLGVERLTKVKVQEITDEGVRAKKDEETLLMEAVTVVIAIGAEPNQTLYQHLAGKVTELFMIGDSKEVRRSADAIREGFEVGCQI